MFGLRTVLVALCTALLNPLVGAAQAIIEARAAVAALNSSTLVVSYQTPVATFTPEIALDDENSSGLTTLSLSDHPTIPVITRTLLIPARGGVCLTDVNIESREERRVRSLEPAAKPDDVRVSLEVGEDGFWPAEAVMIGEPAVLRNYRLVTVTMFPVQVNRLTGVSRLNTNFNFRLCFDGEEVNPLLPEETPPSSVYTDRIIRKLVDNPPRDDGRDSADRGGYLYIVSNVDGVDAVLDTLIQWRRSQGHRVTVAHVEQNAAQNAVRAVIRNAYNAEGSVEFVTIVGDAFGGAFPVTATSEEGDYLYSLIGNDPLPDLAIGRLSARTLQSLTTIVNKIVAYEANPNTDNPAWQLHGGVVAGASINGISEVFVAKYVRNELMNLGFDEVRHWYWPDDGDVAGDQAFLNDWFRWGMSVLHYRAYHLMNNLDTDRIRDLPNRNGPWPAVLAISCETGNFTHEDDGHTEAFLRAAGGGVGAIGTSTVNTNVKFNNLIAGGVWKGIYKDSLFAFGWGLNMGKYELWRAFAGLDVNYLNFLDWNNLMGDAGTELWTGSISSFSVEHARTIGLGASEFPVRVTNSETHEAVAGALVCLYQRDGAAVKGMTDAEGLAVLTLLPDEFNAGMVKLTVTKHNYKPSRTNVEVVQAEQFVGYLDHTLVSGDDGDGLPNPGERLTYRVVIRNNGAVAVNAPLIVSLSSTTDWATVLGIPVRIARNLAPGQTASADFVLGVSDSTPDGAALRFQVRVASGNTGWNSAFQLVAAAPAIEVAAVQFQGSDLVPGEERNLTLRLVNKGHKDLADFEATLSSSNEKIAVIQGRGAFNGVAVGASVGQHGQPFVLRAADDLVRGAKFTLDLRLQSADAPEVISNLGITLGRQTDRDPIGPDKYGYYGFDSGDTAWNMAPEFDWIEIDPNVEDFQYRGTRLDLHDTGDNEDASVVVDLPFEFKYYGRDFDKMTVCSNGWAAFGDQAELADFRNTHIGQALGPNAQIAVWWDNLILAQGSSILTYYDERGGRLIVEWSQMRRLIDRERAGAMETFQLILHSQSSMPTIDENCIITCQYLEVTNENEQAHNDVPFCTIGISNLDDSDGLEYTYYGLYTPGAKRIASEMAIQFGTTLNIRKGVVRGRVTELATGRPIQDATIASNRNFRAVSDDAGWYSMNVVEGNGYSFTAGGFGCNDSTSRQFNIAEDETLTVNFGLRRPSFHSSRDSIVTELGFNQQRSFDVILQNRGNGPLIWNSVSDFGAVDEIRIRYRSYPIGRVAGNATLQGIAYANDHCFVSGRKSDGPPLIFKFDERGALIDTFLQPGETPTAMPDLAWDGHWLWGTGGSMIYAFDEAGGVQQSFVGPFASNKCVAWDDQRELLWISSPRSSIYGLDNRGLAFKTLPNHQLNLTGLAFWRDDPDGYQLYLFDRTTPDSTHIYKVNIETRQMKSVGELPSPERGAPNGAEITNDFINYDRTLAIVMSAPVGSDSGDRADFYQVGSATDWLSLSQDSGTTEAGAESRIVATLNATGLEPETYYATVTISHNAVEDALIMPIRMVVSSLSVEDVVPNQPANSFSIESVWPSPFNSSFSISYTLYQQSDVDIRLIDIMGREVGAMNAGNQPAGRHLIRLNGEGLASGLYILRVESAGEVRTSKVTLVR